MKNEFKGLAFVFSLIRQSRARRKFVESWQQQPKLREFRSSSRQSSSAFERILNRPGEFGGGIFWRLRTHYTYAVHTNACWSQEKALPAAVSLALWRRHTSVTTPRHSTTNTCACAGLGLRCRNPKLRPIANCTIRKTAQSLRWFAFDAATNVALRSEHLASTSKALTSHRRIHVHQLNRQT